MSEKNSIRGKKARASGMKFELKVRKDLEEKGWIIAKWTNNVDLENKKMIPAKRKFNPFIKILSIGTGFPDFIAFKNGENPEIIGVEVKSNKYLDKEEKSKCKWLLENKIFSRILIASKAKENGEIEYIDFAEKYNKI